MQDRGLVLGSLDDRVRELHREHDRKVSLIGWSLGGVYAREIQALPGIGAAGHHTGDTLPLGGGPAGSP